MLPFLASFVLAQAPVVSHYTRFVTKSDGTLEMSTAAQRFVAPGKPDVWLVGAIHIGAKSYYTALQGLLDAQEAVYYEGVRAAGTPAGAAPAKPAAPGPGSPKPTYQILSDAIGLDFQLADIDYRHSNWTNVDLSWKELEAINAAQKTAGGAAGKPSGFDNVKGLLDPNGAMAKQLSMAMGIATPGMKEAIKIMMIRVAGSENPPGLDPATNKIVVQARNKTIVEALAAAATSPKPPKSIAVFYGAMHMPDLQSTLTAKYGYRLDERRWFPAATADPKKVDAMGQTMLDQIDKMLKPPTAAKP